MIERPYSRKRAAQKIGRAESTIDRWIRLNLISAIKIGHSVMIPASEVRRLCGVPESQPAMDFKARACGPDN